MEKEFIMRGTMSYKLAVFFAVILIFAGCSSKTKEQLCSEGIKELERGNPRGAIVLFRNALEKDQNYFDARYQLAMACSEAGRYDQAEKEFMKLARQNPSHPGTKLGLARLYNATGKPDLSIKESIAFLAIKPEDPAGLDALGDSCAIKGNLSDAENYYLRSLKSAPDRNSPIIELAKIYVRTRQTGKTRAFLDEVISRDPVNSKALYVLAALETSLGNKEQALKAYQTISEAHPGDFNAL